MSFSEPPLKRFIGKGFFTYPPTFSVGKMFANVILDIKQNTDATCGVLILTCSSDRIWYERNQSWFYEHEFF